MLADPEAYSVNVATLGKCAGVIYMLWRDREVHDDAGIAASASEIAKHEEPRLFHNSIISRYSFYNSSIVPVYLQYVERRKTCVD